MSLRDYQQTAFDKIISSDVSGIVVAPTGSGKTHIMAELWRYYSPNKSVLFVAWELSVRDQLRQLVPDADIVAPSVQLRDADIIIIDEVHHFHNDWNEWLFAANERWIGFTATPRHCDYPTLYTIAYHTLREDSWIGDRLSALVVKSLKAAISATEGLHTVTYISSRNDWNKDMGRLILADTPAADRHFKDGEYRLACIATLTTGWDDPDIEAIILHRRIGRINPQTYVQILGRLRRGGLVVDLSDNVLRFGLDEDALIAQMRAMDKAESEDKPLGVAPMKRCIKCERLVSPRVTICPHCGTELPPNIEGGDGRFWDKLTDIEPWEKIYDSLGWRENKKCPYTKSGAWPVKLPNGVNIFVSSRTTWHWRNSLHRIIDFYKRFEVYTIDTFLMVLKPEGRVFYSFDYGTGFTEVSV